MPRAMSIDWKQLALVVTGSAGALTYLFLMILVVGHRRRREFERVLFFFSLAMFLLYAAALLLIQVESNLANAPRHAALFAERLMWAGLLLLPGLTWHVHTAYAASRPDLSDSKARPGIWVIVSAYAPLPVLALAWWGLSGRVDSHLDFENAWFVLAFAAIGLPLLFVALANLKFSRRATALSPRSGPERGEARFYAFLAGTEIAIVVALIAWPILSADWLGYSLFVLGCVPGLAIAYAIVRYDFFEISVQRNLVYAVSAAFLALIYLTIVRRVSVWLEPVFPPEGTAAILLFTSLIFFEPLQRVANRVLLRRTREQMQKLQSLSGELQSTAREGNVGRFLAFAAGRIRDDFQLECVRIALTGGDEASAKAQNAIIDGKRPAWAGQPVRMELGKKGAEIGHIEATPAGSLISGETRAALEFLAEQLPAHIALCRAVEQKLDLERELAERERLVLVGQMTASISHTLKNPLGSMKTVLQVQLENPALDAGTRGDLAIVLEELERLNSKVNELLSFARPPVVASGTQQPVNLSQSVAHTVELLKRDAERRSCGIVLSDSTSGATVRGTEEALTDILSNLMVNAIEMSPAGSEIAVQLAAADGHVSICVVDDGPGIPADQQARLFQPFFTTKPGGTGLGLATVARRAADLGGTANCESPVANGRGAKFTVRLPIASS